MLLTKCFYDTTDILQLKSSSAATNTRFSGQLPLRTTTKNLDILCCCLIKNAGTKFHHTLKKRLRMKYNLFLFLLINLLLKTCCGQLLINVQNQGGEVIQESITSNVSEDLITLEFQKTDGTLITQIIDFRNEVRILKALVLGEEERGQNLYQVMCFVTKFQKGDFISSDAMAKLRQKNPSTIRTPEEDKGKETFTMTSWVHLNRSQPITRHLMSVCGEAIDATYVRDVDLKAWSELPGSSISSLEAATEKFPDTLSSRCNEVSSLWAPCICTLETCIGWYPCGLKYCKAIMRVMWIFLIAAIVGLEYSTTMGAPLTKWFKTDNNTYYIETQEKFTWQQSYEECQKKNMGLITLKAYREDELLLQYLTQTFDPKPEFWLKAHENVDLKDINKLLGSMMAADFLNIKLDGINDPEVVQSNNPDNCAINVDGAVKACETLHGFICHENSAKGIGGQNVQNIVLKFN